MNLTALVTSTFPDDMNTNSSVRHFMADGFRELLGAEAVYEAPVHLAAEEILRRQPSIVIAIGSIIPDTVNLWGLRLACDKVNSLLSLWLHDDPYEYDYSFKALKTADIIFTCDASTKYFYDFNKVYHLPMAASPKAHLSKFIPYAKRSTDVLFCGFAYSNRIKLIMQAKTILAKHRTKVLGANWPDFLHFAENRTIPNETLAKLYAGSRFTLNLGRQFNIANRAHDLAASTPGPRTFEAAMAGTVQLFFSDSLEILEYFKANEEILLFDNIDELDSHLSNIDNERLEKIALAAQRRALEEHSYKRRAEAVVRHAFPSLQPIQCAKTPVGASV